MNAFKHELGHCTIERKIDGKKGRRRVAWRVDIEHRERRKRERDLLRHIGRCRVPVCDVGTIKLRRIVDGIHNNRNHDGRGQNPSGSRGAQVIQRDGNIQGAVPVERWVNNERVDGRVDVGNTAGKVERHMAAETIAKRKVDSDATVADPQTNWIGSRQHRRTVDSRDNGRDNMERVVPAACVRVRTVEEDGQRDILQRGKGPGLCSDERGSVGRNVDCDAAAGRRRQARDGRMNHIRSVPCDGKVVKDNVTRRR